MEQMKGLSARSEEVQEIMGRPPHWTLKWGLILLILLVAALVVLAYVMHYPETLRVRLSAASSETTMPIKASSDLRLQSVYVRNGQQVQAGDTLARSEMTGHETSPCKVLLAPFDGVVSFPDERAGGMSFHIGETLFLLKRTPEARHRVMRYHGFLAPEDARRVRSGMSVRLLAAPEASGAFIQGKVDNVAASHNGQGLCYFEVLSDSAVTSDFCDWPDEVETEIVVSNPRIIERLLPHLSVWP